MLFVPPYASCRAFRTGLLRIFSIDFMQRIPTSLVDEDNRAVVLSRLTALWAFAESGLGGILHALHLPFTGVIVGGFAVVMIGLLARYSGYSASYILRATLLVMMVKAIASPHSPVTAYVAVGFQGVAGALLYGLIRRYGLASFLLAFLAMAESAVQKLLVLLLLFGHSLWDSVDQFFAHVLRNFGQSPEWSFSGLLVGLYVLIYLVWGCILGVWLGRLPDQLERQAPDIRRIRLSAGGEVDVRAPGRRRMLRRWTRMGLLIAVATILLVLTSSDSKAVYILLIRSLAGVTLLFFVLSPLLTRLLRSLRPAADSKRGRQLDEILALLPAFRSMVTPAMTLAAGRRGVARYRAFVVYFILIAVFGGWEDERS